MNQTIQRAFEFSASLYDECLIKLGILTGEKASRHRKCTERTKDYNFEFDVKELNVSTLSRSNFQSLSVKLKLTNVLMQIISIL